MADEFFINPMLDDSIRLSLLPADRVPIRILLYTDDPEVITNDNSLMGLGPMRERLQAHAPAFAKVEVEWKSRSSDSHTHANVKLDATLLKDFDEVWFFGLHQVSRDNFTLGILRGGQQSDLGNDEVKALKEWMAASGQNGRGGGVLMTGDHADIPPPDARFGQSDTCPDNHGQEKFFGLGRALGRCVPRAGLLRKWEGPPTNSKADSHNTQSLFPGVDIDSLQLQSDTLPQQLILQTFDHTGRPVPGGGSQVHPLFFYKGGALIQVFPDHAHEGTVLETPDLTDTDMWPPGSVIQPRPYVVARGLDKRNSQLLDVVAAYNGDSAGVGRVVADSSWHHYVHINLLSFPHPAPEGSEADQIGQFYGNLALWLAPAAARRKMADMMVKWLARQPPMLEEVGGDAVTIGRKALLLLSRVAAPCEIHELLQMTVPDDYRAQFETIYFPASGFTLSPFPSKELLLGSAIASYYKKMIAAESSGSNANVVAAAAASAHDAGFRSALEEHIGRMQQTKDEAESFLGNVPS